MSILTNIKYELSDLESHGYTINLAEESLIMCKYKEGIGVFRFHDRHTYTKLGVFFSESIAKQFIEMINKSGTVDSLEISESTHKLFYINEDESTSYILRTCNNKEITWEGLDYKAIFNIYDSSWELIRGDLFFIMELEKKFKYRFIPEGHNQ